MTEEIDKKEKRDFFLGEARLVHSALGHILQYIESHNITVAQFTNYYITSFNDLIFNDVQPGNN